MAKIEFRVEALTTKGMSYGQIEAYSWDEALLLFREYIDDDGQIAHDGSTHDFAWAYIWEVGVHLGGR